MEFKTKKRRGMRVHSRTAPKSSHPDADPGLVPSEAAINAPTQDDFEEHEHRKAIVSIRGKDVKDEKAA